MECTKIALQEVKDNYEKQITYIRYLKKRGSNQELIKAAREDLVRIKSLSSKKNSKKNSNILELYQTSSSWNLYPEFMKVPTDEDGFSLSFETPQDDSHNSKALLFFSKFGFVIFREAISSASCEATISEIWDSLESFYEGVSRHNPTTHAKISSVTYGLAHEPAIFTKQIVMNRTEPNILAIFRFLLDSKDILLSHDRWCFYQKTNSDSCSEMNFLKTASNLHLDLNPWSFYDKEVEFEKLSYSSLRDFSKEINSISKTNGPHLQGVLALTDNNDKDGGTLIIPGFHSTFAGWCNSLGAMKFQTQNLNDKEAGKKNKLIWRGHGSGVISSGVLIQYML
jgi:hypothetical protein